MFSLAFHRFIFATIYITITLAAEFHWQKFQVPLDYSAPQNGSASIAIARYPSTSPKAQYRGPILFNPGGLGGSGVDAIVDNGAAFASVFGDEFDIMGFDPRGISYSTPTISFFTSDAERRFLIPSTTTILYPSLNASSNALGTVWAQNQLLGKLALARDTDDILQHISTDNIARDMLRISEAFGSESCNTGVFREYGSVLGATFATLFPDKVGRIIIDGVFKMKSYFTSNMTSMIEDVDASLEEFFEGCHGAGPEICPFYEPTVSAISAKQDAVTESVKQQPIAVVTPGSYGLMDVGFLRNTVLEALFDPYDDVTGFVPLGKSLAALAKGDATLIYNQSAVPTFECSASNSTTLHENNLEAYMTIGCGDAVQINDTLAELQDYWVGGLKHPCLLRASIPYSSGAVGAKNVSFPLLLVGNRLDAGTAHAGAVQTAEAFPGSVVLTQDSLGHTSLVAPSQCLWGYPREYFVNGTLPAVGTSCPIDIELENSQRLGEEVDGCRVGDQQSCAQDYSRRVL
ncbi:hypothetical protein DFH08DRAFT_1024056 [Mycena albidolilacea]|uniref:Peptidase S33 tripeptidyl aminopeptidase-like C-terminal domain-containing protein n=1 Tax=Mycena albidolilacea TaxID=1033008 RepID=A0AAD6ZLL2_9AGAR|nr:hypothetical protein DFH08DRAFT_1024056 [Mycena albidolilacea]